jgi:hypothetical protein
MGVYILLFVVGGYIAFVAASRRQRQNRRAAAATVSVVVDDWGVRRTLADGRREEVSWAEMTKVEAVTLPRGPWGDTVRFVLYGGEELRGCIVSRHDADEAGLVAALGRLRGLDLEALVDALESKKPGTRVLWQRPAP